MSIIPALVALDLARQRREREEREYQEHKKKLDDAKRCPHCKQYLAVQTASNTCQVVQQFTSTNSIPLE